MTCRDQDLNYLRSQAVTDLFFKFDADFTVLQNSSLEIEVRNAWKHGNIKTKIFMDTSIGPNVLSRRANDFSCEICWIENHRAAQRYEKGPKFAKVRGRERLENVC